MAEFTSKANNTRRIGISAACLLLIGAIAAALSSYWWPAVQPYTPFGLKGEAAIQTLSAVTAIPKEEFYPRDLESAPGILELPTLGLTLDIVYGVAPADLERAPGFYPQSGYPDVGNVSIAGHRNMSGNPFMDLDKLAKGDAIRLTYKGKLYTYEVDSSWITVDTDWSVIDPTPRPALTLTTCDPPVRPPDGHYNRLIVRSYLVKAEKIAR